MVTFQVINTIFPTSKPFVRVHSQKVSCQMFQVSGEMRRKIYPPGHNFLIDLNWMICVEWNLVRNHIVQEHAKSPPVNCFAVALAKDHLGCYPLPAAAQAPGAGLASHWLGKIETGELQITLAVNH